MKYTELGLALIWILAKPQLKTLGKSQENWLEQAFSCQRNDSKAK
jgi:hypothetical protein